MVNNIWFHLIWEVIAQSRGPNQKKQLAKTDHIKYGIGDTKLKTCTGMIKKSLTGLHIYINSKNAGVINSCNWLVKTTVHKYGEMFKGHVPRVRKARGKLEMIWKVPIFLRSTQPLSRLESLPKNEQLEFVMKDSTAIQTYKGSQLYPVTALKQVFPHTCYKITGFLSTPHNLNIQNCNLCCYKPILMVESSFSIQKLEIANS